MSTNHRYLTRSKTGFSHSDESSNSSSIAVITNSFSMDKAFTKTEESTQQYDDHLITSQSHNHQEICNSSIEPQSSPSQVLKPSTAPLQYESIRILQSEVDSLKSELQMHQKRQHPPVMHTMEFSNCSRGPPCPINTSSQSTEIMSNVPPIQYVINIDPLQQMKDFVKPFHGNPDDDATKWRDNIVHFFDIVRLPGNKDELCFQYGPAFLKTYAYRWWIEN